MSTLLRSPHEAYLVLHDVRSVLNVGAMFRTADAAGISKIYCTGYTPTPFDRFGRARSDLAKSALGAEASVPWEQVVDPRVLFDELQSRGVAVVALEQSVTALDYKRYVPDRPFALVVGNERDGVSEALLSRADAVISIPMRGAKESLNVSVALGIALFRILNI